MEGQFIRAFISHGKALIVEHEDSSKTLELEAYMLTTAGTQVLGLGSFEPDVEYMRLIGKGFVTKGFSVKLADWRELSETEGKYSNAQELLGEAPVGEA